MASYEVWHWRVFNAGIRIFALSLAVVGLMFTGSGIRSMVNHSDQPGAIETVPPTATVPGLVEIVLGLVVLAVSQMLLRSRTFRPDLGDATWLVDPILARIQRRERPHRSWWTGDPRGDSDQDAD